MGRGVVKGSSFLYAYAQMETQQNPTKTENPTPATAPAVSDADKQKMLNGQQAQYIDFCAVGGLLTDEDGTLAPMSATKFAGLIGVDRTTLYYWQKSIPDFWDRVKQRRKEMGGNNRIQKVWNGVYLKAASGNPQAAALWLANFDPDFRMPSKKVEHDLGSGLADLIQAKRISDNAERKVIDVSSESHA